MAQSNYDFFKFSVIRTPLFKLGELDTIPKDYDGLKRFVEELYQNQLFREAVFVSSPVLYYQWQKFTENNVPDKKESNILFSVLKYFIRSCANCIPFGLFSTISVSQTDYNIKNTSDSLPGLERETSLDSSVLLMIVKNLNEKQEVNSHLTYFPNQTIYQVGNKLRYIEPKYTNNELVYTLTSVENNEVIEYVLQSSKNGICKEKLLNQLVSSIEGTDTKEIKDFIDEIIHSSILMSELDVCLNSSNPIKIIKESINGIALEKPDSSEIEYLISSLNEIEECLLQMDECIPSFNFNLYKELKSLLRRFDIQNSTNLINIIAKRSEKQIGPSSLTEKDKNKVLDAIKVLSYFTTQDLSKSYSSPNNMSKFVEAFLKRYGDNKEVPLLQVMDNTSGIGYIQNQNDYNSFSELIDDIEFPTQKSERYEIHGNHQIDKFWAHEITLAHKENRYSIDLTEKKVSVFKNREIQLKGTFSLLLNKFSNKLSIVSAGSSTALHYLGRFTVDSQLYSLSKEITHKEDNYFSDYEVAEILHNPSVKSGNISQRNIDRKYEIPILTIASSKEKEMLLKDLNLAVRDGEIQLIYSPSGKRVIPYLSCAQNFHWDTQPIYHFLCDLQKQYSANYLSLNLPSFIQKNYEFIPRITFKNDIILSPAKWIVNKPDLKTIIDEKGHINLDKLKEYRLKRNIPRYVYFFENGREPILIDLENDITVELLLKLAKKSDELRIEEFLFDPRDHDTYANEHVVPLFSHPKPIKLQKSTVRKIIPAQNQASLLPGDGWLYFKIYTGINYANRLIIDFIDPLIKNLKNNGSLKKWFFIRYKDSDFHIRLRFEIKKPSNREEIITSFNNLMIPFLKSNLVFKVEIGTYEPEIQRYFGLISEAEAIFFHDSVASMEVIKMLVDINSNWLICLRSIDGYLEAFEFDIDVRYDLFSAMYNSALKEFNGNKSVQLQVDKKYREHNDGINKIMNYKNKVCIDKNFQTFKKRDKLISHTLENFKDLSEDYRKDLASSFIHMSVNRMISASPGIHEMVFYGLMMKFYKQTIAKRKYHST